MSKLDEVYNSLLQLENKGRNGISAIELSNFMDLDRANIYSKWWIINSSLYATNTKNNVLKAKASNEIQWINKVNEISEGNFAVVEWKAEEVKDKNLIDLLR